MVRAIQARRNYWTKGSFRCKRFFICDLYTGLLPCIFWCEERSAEM